MKNKEPKLKELQKQLQVQILKNEELNERRLKTDRFLSPANTFATILLSTMAIIVTFRLGSDENVAKAEKEGNDAKITYLEALNKKKEAILSTIELTRTSQRLEEEHKKLIGENNSLQNSYHEKTERVNKLTHEFAQKERELEIWSDKVGFSEIEYNLKLLKLFPATSNKQRIFLTSILRDKTYKYHSRTIDSLTHYSTLNDGLFLICNTILHLSVGNNSNTKYIEKIYYAINTVLSKESYIIDMDMFNYILFTPVQWSNEDKINFIRIFMDGLIKYEIKKPDKIANILQIVSEFQMQNQDIKLYNIDYNYFLKFIENCRFVYNLDSAENYNNNYTVLRALRIVCPQIYLSLYYKDFPLFIEGINTLLTELESPSLTDSDSHQKDLQKKASILTVYNDVGNSYFRNNESFKYLSVQIKSFDKEGNDIPMSKIFLYNHAILYPWIHMFNGLYGGYNPVIYKQKLINNEL